MFSCNSWKGAMFTSTTQLFYLARQNEKCPLEAWFAAWWPTKSLSQASWPHSFQETCYIMSPYASKITNTDYYWRSFVFPFELTTPIANHVPFNLFSLGFSAGPTYADTLWAQSPSSSKVASLSSTIPRKTTLRLTAIELMLMSITPFSLLTRLLFFYFFRPWTQKVFFRSPFIPFRSGLGD